MKNMLDTIVFANYTTQDLLVFVSAVIAFFMIVGMLKRVFGQSADDKHFQPAECIGCGWRGRVSRHAGRCPKCNQPLGDQMAGRRR